MATHIDLSVSNGEVQTVQSQPRIPPRSYEQPPDINILKCPSLQDLASTNIVTVPVPSELRKAGIKIPDHARLITDPRFLRSNQIMITYRLACDQKSNGFELETDITVNKILEVKHLPDSGKLEILKISALNLPNLNLAGALNSALRTQNGVWLTNIGTARSLILIYDLNPMP